MTRCEEGRSGAIEVVVVIDDKEFPVWAPLADVIDWLREEVSAGRTDGAIVDEFVQRSTHDENHT